jgi:hypothetical protein
MDTMRALSLLSLWSPFCLGLRVNCIELLHCQCNYKLQRHNYKLMQRAVIKDAADTKVLRMARGQKIPVKRVDFICTDHFERETQKHSQQLGHTQFNSSTNKLSVLRARESICPGLCLTFCLSHCVVEAIASCRPTRAGLGRQGNVTRNVTRVFGGCGRR